MIESNFSDWTLAKLNKAFNLQQLFDEDECILMEKWQQFSETFDISEIEEIVLLNLQKPLRRGGKSWNEFELENKFISPVMMQVGFDDKEMSYFLERKLEAVVGNYKLGGKVDGMVAMGVHEPDIPFFCMQEFKRSMENPGRPDAQALAAMMVAQELNENKKPVYGMYIVGLDWTFMVLEGKQYCIGRTYIAEREDIFRIVKMLKALKKIIKTELI